MATIKQTVKYIMGHAFMKAAMNDPANMEQLLFEVMVHTYLTVADNSAREFRKNRGMNDPVIVFEIRNQEPPGNLDIRLPIPVPCEAVMEVVDTDLGLADNNIRVKLIA